MFYKQIPLETLEIKLKPLQSSDFESLFEVASDPEIWKEHPNKNRYQKPAFQNFFDGAVQSQGAYLVIEKETKKVMGSTRFYDYDEVEKSIFIGYTFYAKKYWGKNINPQVKRIMLDYIFQFVEKVRFHVGASNVRSQKAMERLGAKKIAEIDVAYHGEPIRRNFEYTINKTDWLSK